MAQVALNADLYATPRQNTWFKTTYPSLEGQCVTLVKNFMQDMSSVPNPHSARGDGNDVGNTLVAQGHAVEVPFSERKRGDLICYEYGTYGHIAVQLSGGRVFESNVNMGGVASKIVDGARVYASRIGSENESWRVGKNPHVYRLKTYKEGQDMVIDRNGALWLARHLRFDHTPTDEQINAFVGRDLVVALTDAYDDKYVQDNRHAVRSYPSVVAENAALKKQIAELETGGTTDPKLVALGQAIKEFVKE